MGNTQEVYNMADTGRWFDMPSYGPSIWGDNYGPQSFRYGTGVDPQSLLGGDPAVGSPPSPAAVDPAGQFTPQLRDGGDGRNVGPGTQGYRGAPDGGFSLPNIGGILDGFGMGGGDTQTAGGSPLGGMGSFGGNPYEQAQAWDLAQKGLGLGGAFLASGMGPLGMVAGEVGRRSANEAYRPYGDVGFIEDITHPDFLYGSPEDILSGLKSAQDKVMGGGVLSDDDKKGIADYINTKGGDVTPDDITDQGVIQGSEQARMMAEQMAGFGPEYGMDPQAGVPAGIMDAIARGNMALEQAAMQNQGVAGIMSGLGGGQQTSQADREALAQQETARQQAAAQAAAQAQAEKLRQSGYYDSRGTGTGGWASGSYGKASDYGFDRDRDRASSRGGYGTDTAGSAGGA